MKTYEILQEFEALDDLISSNYDEETGEFFDNSMEIEELLSSIQASRDQKLDNIEALRRERMKESLFLQAEIDRLKKRKSQLDKENEKLIDLENLLCMGEKVKTALYTFSYRKSKAVEIDEMQLPGTWYVEKVEKSPNKKAIKEALDSGQVIPGAKIVERNNFGGGK